MLRGPPVCPQMCEKIIEVFKNNAPHEKMEGICIFLPLQSRISLKHSRNLEEFKCVKDKGASLSWTPVTSDPSDGAASRTVIHQQLIEAHGQGITVGNLCQALQSRVPFTSDTSN